MSQLKIKYPKLLLLLITFVLAYFIFYGKTYPPLHNFLFSLGYLGIFIAGGLYAYGFTAAPATAVLLALAKEHDIFTAALIGGIGALISDLIIFYFIRSTFSDEISRLSRNDFIRGLNREGKELFGSFKKYITAAFAGFFIASPLPSEIGVTMMASLKQMSVIKFTVIAYCLHTIGIFIILYIGTLI